jgi:hypothetical protein
MARKWTGGPKFRYVHAESCSGALLVMNSHENHRIHAFTSFTFRVLYPFYVLNAEAAYWQHMDKACVAGRSCHSWAAQETSFDEMDDRLVSGFLRMACFLFPCRRASLLRALKFQDDTVVRAADGRNDPVLSFKRKHCVLG